jgi:hypothetical protein
MDKYVVELNGELTGTHRVCASSLGYALKLTVAPLKLPPARALVIRVTDLGRHKHRMQTDGAPVNGWQTWLCADPDCGRKVTRRVGEYAK